MFLLLEPLYVLGRALRVVIEFQGKFDQQWCKSHPGQLWADLGFPHPGCPRGTELQAHCGGARGEPRHGGMANVIFHMSSALN